MTITPQDIQNKEFREAFRGYNEDDVDTFLDGVAEEYGRLFAENQRLRIQLASVQQDAAQRGVVLPDADATVQSPVPAAAPGIRAEERAEAREEMKRALVATQRAAEAALEEAKRRAAEIVSRAETRAKEIDEMTARRAKDVDAPSAVALETIQERIEQLKRQESELRSRLRRMLAEHVKMLQQLEGESIAATAAMPPGPKPDEPLVDPAGPTETSPQAAKRATRWDTPRVKALPPDGPRPAGLGMRPGASSAPPAPSSRPMGLRPDGPAANAPADAAARAAVVARMAKELGEAAVAPDPASLPNGREAFWRR